MDNCIFCQIVSGRQPAYLIHQDDRFMAFLDLYPFGPGHTLVIPKDHHRWVFDVPDYTAYMLYAQKIALHLAHVMGTETTYTLIFGEQVPHAHIHLLPPLPETQARLFQGIRPLRQGKMTATEAGELIKKLQFT
jgi:histidine triad (HIT) family protein